MNEATIGEIRLFSGNFAPLGWAFCDGQTLPIESNEALFSILGTQYGGNGSTDFQLPNLAPLKEADGGKTPIRYVIALQGIYPSRGGSYPAGDSTIGEIRLFAGDFEPSGWAFSDGQTLSISNNQALFSILWTQYGGDGKNTFQLPKLAPLKEADGGETLIRYVIALQGIYPSRGDRYSAGDSTIGEIRLFSGNFEPSGWAFSDGQTLSLSQNSALFSILGIQYGGDGKTNFQLPKLAPLKEADGGETPIRYIISLTGCYPIRP